MNAQANKQVIMDGFEDVFTLRDGKVIRTDAYYDSAPVEKAFRPVQPGQGQAPELRH